MARALGTLPRFVTALLAALLVAAPAAAEEFSQVSVVVNVLKGAKPATDADIKAAVAAASGILKQANIELSVAKINRDVSDGGNDNGIVSPEEAGRLRTAGQAELDAVVGKGKGFKLYIALTCDSTDSNALGETVHDIPVSIVEHPPAPADWGWVIAHEFGHAFTLHGHADPNGVPWGQDHLMYDKFGQGGTVLSAAQLAELKKKGGDRGTTEKQATPSSPTPKKIQNGGNGTDKQSGDPGEPSGLPPKSDLRRCEMFSDSTSGLMSGNLQFQGLYDSTQVTNSLCQVFIDSDSLLGTGQLVTVDGRTLGADYRIDINVTGSGGSGGLHLSGQVVRTSNAQATALSGLVLEHEELHTCFGSGVAVTPVLDQINFAFPVSFLGTLAPRCQAGARVSDFVAGTTDESRLDLIRTPATNPVVTLGGYRVPMGSTVTVNGAGFTPFADVPVSIDGVLAVTAHTNGVGGFSTSIIAPNTFSSYFWIDAREPNGGPSDFTILHDFLAASAPAAGPRAAAAALALVICAGAVTLARRRRREAGAPRS